MKVGEKAIFKCRSHYAYGDTGMSPEIPGGATLLYDVRILKQLILNPSSFELAMGRHLPSFSRSLLVVNVFRLNCSASMRFKRENGTCRRHRRK
mmetsp:Transcript_16592/g.22284  ORF Transcript_16592/g.22284 Transcript_16592/m.22284 type:complete len:94 (-) Transcript_16592:601-882(-)